MKFGVLLLLLYAFMFLSKSSISWSCFNHLMVMLTEINIYMDGRITKKNSKMPAKAKQSCRGERRSLKAVHPYIGPWGVEKESEKLVSSGSSRTSHLAHVAKFSWGLFGFIIRGSTLLYLPIAREGGSLHWYGHNPSNHPQHHEISSWCLPSHT